MEVNQVLGAAGLTSRAARRGAWSLWCIAMLLTLAACVLIYLTRTTPAPVAFLFRGSEGILATSMVTVGAIVAAKRPSNPIGWLFSAAGVAAALLVFSEHYAVWALLTRGGSVPGGMAAAWLQAWIGIPGYFVPLGLVLLLFPDGCPLSRRWGYLSWLMVATLPFVSIGLALRPGPLDVLTSAENPFGAAGSAGRIASAVAHIAETALLVAVAASAISMVIRFRRSTGAERQQIKWFAYAASVVAVLFAAFVLFGIPKNPVHPINLAFLTGLAALPAAAGVAVLRYRLYDIDRIVSRTLAYALVTASLVGIYLVFVLGLGGLLRPVTGGDDFAVAASTLAAAAAFRPVRRRFQSLVDRRFNRSRYDAQRTIEAFAARLRDEIDIEHLRADLTSVVRSTMQPSVVSLWMARRTP